MNPAQDDSRAAKSKRLSPELNEFLHMLTALEQQVPASASPPAR